MKKSTYKILIWENVITGWIWINEDGKLAKITRPGSGMICYYVRIK